MYRTFPITVVYFNAQQDSTSPPFHIDRIDCDSKQEAEELFTQLTNEVNFPVRVIPIRLYVRPEKN